ncbi:MAG TPA: hypothetical protein QF606_04885 [Anaerolineales bacterium]|nr:hypothetical protein [Anaerolineales bacterium]
MFRILIVTALPVAKLIIMPIAGSTVYPEAMAITIPMADDINPPKIVPPTIALFVLSSIYYFYIDCFFWNVAVL